ncbi:MAG: hypothetical protein FWB78_03350 [Treponema sp.]|nr:hypothetical protein [Treponema sp.]
MPGFCLNWQAKVILGSLKDLTATIKTGYANMLTMTAELQENMKKLVAITQKH